MAEMFTRRDIEEVIVDHPDVAEVAVFGVPHNKWGEVPIIAVVTLNGKELVPADIVAWTNERVAAKFQRVADCVVLAEFPRNVAGKTLKKENTRRLFGSVKPSVIACILGVFRQGWLCNSLRRAP